MKVALRIGYTPPAFREDRQAFSLFGACVVLASSLLALSLVGCGVSVIPGGSTASSGQVIDAETPQQIPSMPLRAFQDSLGINVHMSYTDGLYSQPQQVLADLNYIGIRNVRDGVLVVGGDIPDRQGLAAQEYLAENGIRFNFITNGNTSFEGFTTPGLTHFATAHPGSILSIEGPNEINNWPITGPGTNQQNAVAYQSELYQFVHSTPSLSSIPVLYFTGGDKVPVSSLAAEADQLNGHPYAQAGQQPYSWLSGTYSSSFTGSGSYPEAMTETGYSTAEQGNYNGVDEATQASLILNNLFDAALIGSTHTYLYQLLEAYPDYASNGDTGYGIFHYTDGSPKLAAVALHNLNVSIPKDETSSPQSVSGVVTGLSATTGHVLALTASDGLIYLALWDEQNIWNPNTQTSVHPSGSIISVSIPGNWTVSSLDPLTGLSVAMSPALSNGTYLYTVSSTTHVTFLVFRPAD